MSFNLAVNRFFFFTLIIIWLISNNLNETALKFCIRVKVENCYFVIAKTAAPILMKF